MKHPVHLNFESLRKNSIKNHNSELFFFMMSLKNIVMKFGEDST